MIKRAFSVRLPTKCCKSYVIFPTAHPRPILHYNTPTVPSPTNGEGLFSLLFYKQILLKSASYPTSLPADLLFDPSLPTPLPYPRRLPKKKTPTFPPNPTFPSTLPPSLPQPNPPPFSTLSLSKSSNSVIQLPNPLLRFSRLLRLQA